ncbi:MAG: hypothetical protein EOP84_29370, partial [Verrucomicrobiaceae bacterium]
MPTQKFTKSGAISHCSADAEGRTVTFTLLSDHCHVEMRAFREALDQVRRDVHARNRDRPYHERLASLGEMIAATIASPSTNYESEMFAVAGYAHTLLSLRVSEDVHANHDWVIVHVVEQGLRMQSYGTEEDYLAGQEELVQGKLDTPT